MTDDGGNGGGRLDRRELEALRQRVAAARARQEGPKGPSEADTRASSEGLALGLRIVVELVASVVVGTGIGYGLDRWWGTLPWMLLLFFILGSVAGVTTVYRTATEYERRRREADTAGTKR